MQYSKRKRNAGSLCLQRDGQAGTRLVCSFESRFFCRWYIQFSICSVSKQGKRQRFTGGRYRILVFGAACYGFYDLVCQSDERRWHAVDFVWRTGWVSGGPALSQDLRAARDGRISAGNLFSHFPSAVFDGRDV